MLGGDAIRRVHNCVCELRQPFPTDVFFVVLGNGNVEVGSATGANRPKRLFTLNTDTVVVLKVHDKGAAAMTRRSRRLAIKASVVSVEHPPHAVNSV